MGLSLIQGYRPKLDKDLISLYIRPFLVDVEANSFVRSIHCQDHSSTTFIVYVAKWHCILQCLRQLCHCSLLLFPPNKGYIQSQQVIQGSSNSCKVLDKDSTDTNCSQEGPHICQILTGWPSFNDTNSVC